MKKIEVINDVYLGLMYYHRKGNINFNYKSLKLLQDYHPSVVP